MKKRPIYQELKVRMEEPRRFIQVLFGPRQVGKTTLAHQISQELGVTCLYASADTATLQDQLWIRQQWDLARLKAKESETILMLDEIQKIENWSGIVKTQWDEDTKNKTPLKVILLGSSPWQIQKGLTESLAGRFEQLAVTHWPFTEMRDCFDWNLDQYIYFGGYPGAADLINDENRWKAYINDSLIETTISRDILLMTQVNKPALLRRLFQLGCNYSGQILSYQKMIGQLQDAGNTTTLAHYLELLSGAGLLTGIQKFAGQTVRQKSSSPKFQVFNTALMSTQDTRSFAEARSDNDYWGRLVESAIGAHLLNGIRGTNTELFYWRDANKEVDFILRNGSFVTAIEVNSGGKKMALPGMDAFNEAFKPNRLLLIGDHGVDLEEFLSSPVTQWVT